MYIQPKRAEPSPTSLPEGYSGSAFSHTPMQEAESDLTAPSAEVEREAKEAIAVPAAAIEEEKSESGAAFARFPLLSALLPPKRGKKEGGDLPEWVLIAAVFLLLFADGEKNDILPFLLLLLLWD